MLIFHQIFIILFLFFLKLSSFLSSFWPTRPYTRIIYIDIIFFFTFRFKSLHKSEDKTQFINFLQALHADFLVPLFSVKHAYGTAKNILKTIGTAKDPSLQGYVLNPKHAVSVQDFWKTKGLGKRISTGKKIERAKKRDGFLFFFFFLSISTATGLPPDFYYYFVILF